MTVLVSIEYSRRPRSFSPIVRGDHICFGVQDALDSGLGFRWNGALGGWRIRVVMHVASGSVPSTPLRDRGFAAVWRARVNAIAASDSGGAVRRAGAGDRVHRFGWTLSSVEFVGGFETRPYDFGNDGV